MPGQHEEFDLDLRLHGRPVGLSLQAETEQEECNTLDTFCDCEDRTQEDTCDGLAQTCNTCGETCGGPDGTFCADDTCGGPAQTCHSCDCQTLVGCPTHGCDTTETCKHQLCPGEGETELGGECESDGCGGDAPGPDRPDDPPVHTQGEDATCFQCPPA